MLVDGAQSLCVLLILPAGLTCSGREWPFRCQHDSEGVFCSDSVDHVQSSISDQCLMASTVALTLYDYLLIFSDEVRKEDLCPFAFAPHVLP